MRLVNDTFSNNYNYRILTNSGGMAWRYNSKKFNASLGSDVAVADFNQDDVVKSATRDLVILIFSRGQMLIISSAVIVAFTFPIMVIHGNLPYSKYNQ